MWVQIVFNKASLSLITVARSQLWYCPAAGFIFKPFSLMHYYIKIYSYIIQRNIDNFNPNCSACVLWAWKRHKDQLVECFLWDSNHSFFFLEDWSVPWGFHCLCLLASLPLANKVIKLTVFSCVGVYLSNPTWTNRHHFSLWTPFFA